MERSLFIVGMIFLFAGCRSSEISQQSVAGSAEVHGIAANSSKAGIRPNASLVSGIINSIDLIDSLQFRLSLQISSSLPAGSMESFAEIGQEVVASPQFYLGEGGTMDLFNERNQRLLKVRDAKSGDMFIGKICLDGKGRWLIVEVESQ